MSLMDRVRKGPYFDNKALRVLPVDTGDLRTRTVPNACFSRVTPTAVDAPRMVIASSQAFDLVNLPKELAYQTADNADAHQELVLHLAGNRIWPMSDPAAHCYCGHQFGTFAGQLGDGAVIYLGEVINDKGERWELQLKGAGLTPFSRQGDGRKVLRSSLREFLCSEAMHHLGIPTTRAASVITSDTRVQRDVFYTGDIIWERASVTSRIAPSFIRFGSFEITKPQDPVSGRRGPSFGNREILPQLVNYVMETFYPDIWTRRDPDDLISTYLAFFQEVVRRTATLVALWQTVGFCHGVLNTDNMSILGLTMDYGPFGFMDRFSWDHICNASDTEGRYSYAQQPSVCAWNCARLAECLIRALNDGVGSSCASEQDLQARFRTVLDTQFMSTFKHTYLEQMRKKLGLFASDIPEDEELTKSLFDTMERTGADMTNTFLALCTCVSDAYGRSRDLNGVSMNPDLLVNECCSVDELREAYEPSDIESQREQLLRFSGIIRHLVERIEDQKILKPEEKARRLQQLEGMTDENKRVQDRSLWQVWLNSYAARLKEDMLRRPDITSTERVERMKSANPRLVLRNYLAEQVIRAAESDDYTPARQLLAALCQPFSREIPSPVEAPQAECTDFLIGCSRPPEWARDLRVT